MFSRLITVPVPGGVKEVRVEDAPTHEPLYWRALSGERQWIAAESGSIPTEAGRLIEIVCGEAVAHPVALHDTGGPRLGPVTRRLLTAGRDRMLPSIHRLAAARHSHRLA